MMTFSEMPYKRPDPEEVTAEIKEATEKLRNAKSYEEARAVFLEEEERSKAVETAGTLAYIRHGTSFTAEKKHSGTTSDRKLKNINKRGLKRCSAHPSGRILKQSTATCCS